MTRFDAVVIGGGPAGATAALTLARGGLSVAVVEAESFPRRKVCGEYLSATSLVLFDSLGLAPAFCRHAGPEIRRIALFCGEARPAAALRAVGGVWGRALGRDLLDTMLLDAARDAGAEVFQPWRAVGIGRDGERTAVRIAAEREERVLEAPVVIAAHGSWQPGPLPSHLPRTRRAGDLFGFKAHFTDAELDLDLMPLLAFPGGYGGMVTADDGRLSFSCCVRRDTLAALRGGGTSAAQAVLCHVVAHCDAASDVLRAAHPLGRWLSAGPIRPGLRATCAEGMFRVGNTAFEAHPLIAEGISMAIQSGWLAGEALLEAGALDAAARTRAARRYGRAMRRSFSGRIRAAAALAALAGSRRIQRLAVPLIEAEPAVLALGAWASGKYRLPTTEVAGRRRPSQIP